MAEELGRQRGGALAILEPLAAKFPDARYDEVSAAFALAQAKITARLIENAGNLLSVDQDDSA